jgi:tetratricopeptide (TPR) repeat protein
VTRCPSFPHAQGLVLLAVLCFDWGIACIPPIHGIQDPRNLVTLAAYVAVVGAFYIALRKRMAPALLGLALALGTFVPASNVFMFVGTELAERLLYLPSIGVAIAVACWFPETLSLQLLAYVDWILGGYAGYWEQYVLVKGEMRQDSTGDVAHMPASKRRAFGSWGVDGRWLLLLLACSALAWRTHVRHQDWRSEFRVFESGYEVCPRSVKALNNIGFLLMDENKLDEAIPYLKAALDVWPDLSTSAMNLGIIYYRKSDFKQAMHWLWKYGCTWLSWLPASESC